MREIKFREWDLEYKKMQYNVQNTTVFWSFLKDKTSVVMQYTGLKDKNGKEIYEGDIVRYGDEDTNIVEWANHAGMYQLCDKTMCADSPLPQRECEIIGNIYETPELLK